jgi:hydroxypyruvate reductase
VRESLLARPLRGDWRVVGIGKAAGAMALGAHDALAERCVDGLVVVPAGHVPDGLPALFRVHVAAHPMPDESSLAAGEVVADYARSLAPDAQALFLVSGGASSLVEWLRPGLGLDDLQAVNAWALASGASIERINAVRRRLSRLKGGGLARLVGASRAVALMISDVPGDDPRVLGSGLLHAPSTPTTRVESLPPGIAAIVDRAEAAIDAEIAHRTLRVPYRMVATSRLACLAAAHAGAAIGLSIDLGRRRFHGDATVLGKQFAMALARIPDRGLLIRGGESTVELPSEPGRGGRNQHLALAAARTLESRDVDDAWLLAAGSDGIDGNTSDAGAIVDARTCLRGRDAGYDAAMSLQRADAGTLLEASGDLLYTGATLTNVGDLVLGLRWRGSGE